MPITCVFVKFCVVSRLCIPQIVVVMTNEPTATKPDKTRTDHLSKDGKWRSFPKTPGLLQYVSTGTYFARVKHNGKLFRSSLVTTVFSTAKEKLPDFCKERKTKKMAEGTFADALAKYKWSLEHEYGLSPFTVRYRKMCIEKLLSFWVGLKESKLKNLTARECKERFGNLSTEIDAQYFNNILGTFRAILEKGGITKSNDPTRQQGEAVKRMGVKVSRDELPEDVLTKMVEYLEASSAWRHHRAAELLKFVAYSGCRISEANKVTWADVDFDGGFITVHNAKKRNYQNHQPTRLVPIIQPMRELLEKLGKNGSRKNEKVLPFSECYGSLNSARKHLGIAKLTHHTFRGWFGTRALESGVDVPTVAEWLGHVDGGALLLKRYAKANKAHSLKMAQKFNPVGTGKALV
jgi:integrase